MKQLLLSLSFLFLTAGVNDANALDCGNQLLNGQMPKVINSVFAKRTHYLCYSEMALLHSGETRTALWSAAYLTRDRVQDGKSLSREDNFHEEESIPRADRATLDDYRGSMSFELQRGHLVANKDTSTRQAQYESFSLANIIPQNGHSNGNLWSSIEQRVRGMATQQGALYVVTGPVFDDSTNRLKGRVLIPKRLFKAVYDVKTKQAGAYLSNNAEGWDYQVISINALTKIIGIDVFPSLPNASKDQVLKLPEIRARKQRDKFLSF